MKAFASLGTAVLLISFGAMAPAFADQHEHQAAQSERKQQQGHAQSQQHAQQQSGQKQQQNEQKQAEQSQQKEQQSRQHAQQQSGQKQASGTMIASRNSNRRPSGRAISSRHTTRNKSSVSSRLHGSNISHVIGNPTTEHGNSVAATTAIASQITVITDTSVRITIRHL